MSCCKNGIFLPWVKDCEGELRTIRDGETLRVDGQIVPTPILSEDLTIYMTVGGSDSSGTGTSDKPFKTLHRCHEEVLKYIPGNYEITIDVGVGLFEHTSTFRPSWLYGPNVIISGKRTSATAGDVDNFVDWDSGVTSSFGISGTAAVNDTPAASGDTSLTVNTVVLDTTDTDLIPIGAQFTIASETSSPIHTVTARTPTSTSPTTDITFVPETNTGVIDTAVITFLPRPANEDYPSGGSPTLQYFDCDVDLSALDGTTKAGHFLAVYTVSGAATNKEALIGMHKIISWNSTTEVATLRVFQRSGVTEAPSGAMAISDANVIHSVIKFHDDVDDHGIEVNGYHSGNWQSLVVEGNQNQYDSRRGLSIFGSGAFKIVNRVGFHNFDVGVEITGGGSVELSSNGYISKMLTLGISVQNGGCRFLFSRMNAIGTSAAWVQGGGVFLGSNSTYVASSQFRNIFVQRTGDADVNLSDFYYEDSIAGPLAASNACLDCRELGRIESTSATFTGYTYDKYEASGGAINP